MKISGNLFNSFTPNAARAWRIWKPTVALMIAVFGFTLLAGCGGARNNPSGDQNVGPGGGRGGQVAATRPQTPQFKIPVTAQEIQRGRMISYLQAVGTVVPVREIELKPEMTGRIYFTQQWMEGDMVQRGDVLARVDDRQLRLDLEDAQLNLQLARAAIGPASAELAQTYKDEEFKRAMYERGAISKAEYDQAVLARVRQQNLFEQTSSSVETRRNALERLRKEQERVEVVIPFDGVLLPVQQNVSAAQREHRANLTLLNDQNVAQGTVLCKLANIEQVYIALDVPARDLSDIEIGQTVELEIYSRVGRDYIGTVAEISTALNATTRTYTVNVLVENPDQALRPGMFAKARIITEEKLDAISVPRELVLLRNNRNVLFVVKEKPVEENRRGGPREEEEQPSEPRQIAMAGGASGLAHAADAEPSERDAEEDFIYEDQADESEVEQEWIVEERIVTTGIENRERMEIVDGLRAGEFLVVLGYETITDGVDVNVTFRPLDDREFLQATEESTASL